MRKLLVILLALLMVLGLCSCDGQTTETSKYDQLKNWLEDQDGIECMSDGGMSLEAKVADSGVDLKDLEFEAFKADSSNTAEKPFENYKDKPFMERLAFAGMVTLEGLGMIFAVLALLWGILELFRVFMDPKKKAPKTEEQPAAVPAEETPAVVAESDDAALIAVISAAVAAYLEAEGNETYSGGFRVVSFKRAGNGSAWNQK